MENVLLGLFIVLLHLVLALYASLVIKDTLKLSVKAKSFFYAINFLLPLIGYAISMTVGGNNKKNSSTKASFDGSGASSNGGYSSSCDGGGGE